MDATATENRLHELIVLCSRRGFQRFTPILLVVVALIPAVLLTLTRNPGSDDTLLIAGLFVLVPAVLLVRAAMRDQDGQGARELVMWLRVMSKAEWQVIPPSVDRDLDQLSTATPQFDAVARDVRDELAPHVASPATLSVRIAIYRYWYALVWTVLATFIVLGFFFISGGA